MKININVDTQANATELHLAAQEGKLEDCKRLYSANNKLEEDEITEAYCAVSFNNLTDSQDQWVRTHSGHCFQYSALALCLESNLKHPIIRSYLGKMALANIIPWKQTPMHYAIAAKHPSIVEFFLSRHEFTAIEVYQLLQFAAYCSNKAISELIYTAWQNKGGDIPNEAHYTPLMIALMKDHETSQFLLNTIDYTFATKHRCPEGKSLFCYLTLSPLAWEGNIPHNLKALLQQNLLALLQQDLSTEDKKLYSRYARLTMSQKLVLRMIGNNIITKDNYRELGNDANQALRIELFMAVQQGDINFLNDLALYQKEFNFNFSVDGEYILEAALNSPEPKAFKIILNYIQRNEQSVQVAFIEKFFDKLLPAAPEKLIEPLEQILERYILLNEPISLSKTAELVICNCLTLAAFQGRDQLLDTYKRVNLSPKMSTESLQDMSSSAKKLMEALHQNNKSAFMDIFADLYQRIPNFMSRPLAYVTIMRNEQAREWVQELITNGQTDLSSVLPYLLDYALNTNDNDLFTISIDFLSPQNRMSYMIERAFDALDDHRQLYSHLSILQKNGFSVNNITFSDSSTQAKQPTIIYAFQKQALPLFQICCEGIEKHPIPEGVLNQLYAMMLDQELSPAPYMQLLAKVSPLNQVQIQHGHNNLTLLEYGVNHNKDWLVALCLKQEEDRGFSKEQKVSALKSALQLNRSSIVRTLLFCGAIDPFIDKFLPNNTLGYLTLTEHVRFSQKIWLKKLLCEYAILQGQVATHLIQGLVRQHINSLKIVSDGKSYSVLTYAVVHEKDWLFNLCLECPFSGDTSELSLAALYQAIIHGRQQYFEKIIEYFKMDISKLSITIGTNLSLMEHAIITSKMFLLEHCAKALNPDNLSAWANCIAIALETDDQAALRIMAQHIHFDTPPEELRGLENVLNSNQEEVFRTLVKMGYVSPNTTLVDRAELFLFALNQEKDWLMEACLLDTSNPIKCDDDHIERAFKYALEGNKTELISALLSRFEEKVLNGRYGHAYPTILNLENEDLRSALLTRMLKTTDKLREQKALFDYKDRFWDKMSVEALNCPSFNIESLSSDDYYHMNHQQLNIIINRSRPSWKKVIDLLISMSPIAAIKMTVKTIKSYFHTTFKQPPSRSKALLGPAGHATQASGGGAHRLDLEDAASLGRRHSQY